MADDQPPPASSPTPGLDRVARALSGARHVCVLTGAGISAESGIPTFRDALTGLWENFRPEELASPEAFEQDPAFVWKWYEWRRELVRRAEPNPGHHALAELARRVPRLTLVTQNVDGLHQRAGSTGVIEYHGNILRDRCVVEQVVADRSRDVGGELPRCASCGGLLRPDVVWFGEAIPRDALLRADAGAADCDVFLSIGTSSLVYPAAGLADEARRRGAFVAEINKDATDLSSRVHAVVRGPSGELLPELLRRLGP
ncbi:MAG: NAD-dependent deacylase [Lysobacterales bacterium]|nr:MAG: NAD-dependent deacylase [Xanthomonadales bacterium]